MLDFCREDMLARGRTNDRFFPGYNLELVPLTCVVSKGKEVLVAGGIKRKQSAYFSTACRVLVDHR